MARAPTHVSFRGAFPKDHSPTHPAGRELADVLERAFRSQRLKVRERGQTDYSHTFVLECGGRRFSAMLGVVDDPDAEWLFFFHPSGVWLFLESPFGAPAPRTSQGRPRHSGIGWQNR
jgi:hypothetical protein